MPAPVGPEEHQAMRRAPARSVAIALAAAAYALGAAATTPFTWQANLMTALPIAAFAVAVVWRWPRHPHWHAAPGQDRDHRAGHRYRAWGALLVVVVAWELVEYLAPGARGAHPTLSSMANAVDRHLLPKALMFAAWLFLGALMVRAGAGGTSAPPP